MVPLRDNNPTTIIPYITYGLIAVNVVVFLHEMSLSPAQLTQFFQEWAVVPRNLTAALGGNIVPLPVFLTLITSQFLHGGFLHLGGNMFFLWIFGNNVEDCLGHIRFIIFYLGCGILASLAQYYFSASDSQIPSLGASGAIAGVMGAYVLRYPRAMILTLIPLGFFTTFIRLPAFLFLGFWFVQQALLGLNDLQSAMDSGGVAYWAHAGGFLFGAILGPLLGLFDRHR